MMEASSTRSRVQPHHVSTANFLAVLPAAGLYTTTMGQTSSQPSPTPAASPAKCPIEHVKPPQCPVDHGAPKKPAECPVDHSAINPANQMPQLSQDVAPEQQTELPTSRVVSSIPRDGNSKWEYPSPQQFYNALVRKGWETPEEHVETMVHIHNFLNEEAWEEVKKWEQRVDPQYAAFIYDSLAC